MTAAVDVRVTQAATLASAAGTAVNLRVTQAAVLTAYSFPSTTMRTTQGAVLAYVNGKPTLRTTQAAVLVLWAGRSDNRKLRAWGFSLDGHDFYVLRCGINETFVFDISTRQWSRWASPNLGYWVAHLGLNWLGVGSDTLSRGYSWNVVAGDDTTGTIYMVDPAYSTDSEQGNVETEFTRQAVGALPMRLRQSAQCAAVYLTASVGSPALTGDQVTLDTSDNNGADWLSQGSITITGDAAQELSWLGLGLITAPGRLFRITDTGALQRISSLDMRP